MASATTTFVAMIPTGTPPPGVLPNYEHPHSLWGATTATNVMIIVIGTFCLVCRLIAIFGLQRPHWWDDRVFLAAYLLIMARAISVQIGASQFVVPWDIRPNTPDSEVWHKDEFCNLLFGETGWFLSRISILLFYLRIFKIQPWVRGILYFTMFYVFAIYIIVITINMYIRTPDKTGIWLPPHFTHYNKEITMITQCTGWWNLSQDILIFLIPIPSVIALHAPLATKLRFLSVFLIGSIAIVGASISLWLRLEAANLYLYGGWFGGLLTICSTCELTVSLIISSSSAIRQVFQRKFLNKLKSPEHKWSAPKSLEATRRERPRNPDTLGSAWDDEAEFTSEPKGESSGGSSAQKSEIPADAKSKDSGSSHSIDSPV